jgi:hypothetical protein
MRRPRPHKQFFQAAEPRSGFAAIAPTHYKSARKLLQHAESVCAESEMKFCFYVLSAICLFHACLECYLNEELALSLFRLRSRVGEEDPRVDQLIGLQDRPFGRQKLSDFLEAYGFGGRIAGPVIDEVVALCELRDRLYHYTPEMKPVNECPEAVAAVLTRAGVDVIRTSWPVAISHLKVGAWAKQVVEKFLETYCATKGETSPFSAGPQSLGWTIEEGLAAS